MCAFYTFCVSSCVVCCWSITQQIDSNNSKANIPSKPQDDGRTSQTWDFSSPSSLRRESEDVRPTHKLSINHEGAQSQQEHEAQIVNRIPPFTESNLPPPPPPPLIPLNDQSLLPPAPPPPNQQSDTGHAFDRYRRPSLNNAPTVAERARQLAQVSQSQAQGPPPPPPPPHSSSLHSLTAAQIQPTSALLHSNNSGMLLYLFCVIVLTKEAKDKPTDLACFTENFKNLYLLLMLSGNILE